MGAAQSAIRRAEYWTAFGTLRAAWLEKCSNVLQLLLLQRQQQHHMEAGGQQQQQQQQQRDLLIEALQNVLMEAGQVPPQPPQMEHSELERELELLVAVLAQNDSRVAEAYLACLNAAEGLVHGGYQPPAANQEEGNRFAALDAPVALPVVSGLERVMDWEIKQSAVESRLRTARLQGDWRSRQCVLQTVALILFGGFERLLSWAGMPAYTEYARLALALPWVLSLYSLALVVLHFATGEPTFVDLVLALTASVVALMIAGVVLLKDDLAQRKEDIAELRLHQAATAQLLLQQSAALRTLPRFTNLVTTINTQLAHTTAQAVLAERRAELKLRRLAFTMLGMA